MGGAELLAAATLAGVGDPELPGGECRNGVLGLGKDLVGGPARAPAAAERAAMGKMDFTLSAKVG